MSDQPANDNVSPVPNEATRQALAAHATRAILNQARVYARSRVQLLRRFGWVTSRSTARELVDDAYADTWIGREQWNPAECCLGLHLRRVILQRTWRELRRLKKISIVPIHPVNSNVAQPEADEPLPIDEVVERALDDAAANEVDPAELQSLLASVCEQLTAQVTDDHEAVLLACWAAGRLERDEIIAATGFDHTIYDRTRKRLMYRARHLSAELGVAAHHLLRSAS